MRMARHGSIVLNKGKLYPSLKQERCSEGSATRADNDNLRADFTAHFSFPAERLGDC